MLEEAVGLFDGINGELTCEFLSPSAAGGDKDFVILVSSLMRSFESDCCCCFSNGRCLACGALSNKTAA